MAEQQFTRRSLVHAAGLGVTLGALGCTRLTAAQAVKPAALPLFRFVQWNDVHIDKTQPPGYRLANEKMTYLVEWVNDAKRLPRTDFVIGIGDMIHGGDLQSLPLDTRLEKTFLSDLRMPFYPVMGNHENVQKEGDREYEAAFREAFGEDRTNYTLKHEGLLFVMLNNSGAPNSNSSAVGLRRNQWLRRILSTSANLPKIICCHIPLVPLRDEAVLAKSFGFTSYAAGDDQLLSLVDEHAKSIIAVLSGHLHLTGVVTRNGVHHVSISGTASYPCDFASYDVFPDRIRLRVHSLPEKLLTPHTDIHGRRRHGLDFTDSEHPTHESYVKGNPSERNRDMMRSRSPRRTETTPASTR